MTYIREVSLFLMMTILLSCRTNQISKADQIPYNGDWIPENVKAIGSSILVPENHNNPDGKKIQISYLVLKAENISPSKYPVIYFNGGPGARTINKTFIEFFSNSPLRETRDIILFDQRGTGFSSEIPNMSADLFEVLSKDVDELEEAELIEKIIVRYKDVCKRKGITLDFYNSTQNAKDVRMLFQHLGYKKYNLYGVSYGTRLARTVQDMFPKFVHTSILDSPAPVGDFLFDRLSSYSLALERIFKYCETDFQCNEKHPELREDYFSMLSRLKKNPFKVSRDDTLDFHINAQDGMYLFRRLLYRSDSREKAPLFIKALANGSDDIIKEIIKDERELAKLINYSMLLSVEKYENFNYSDSLEALNKVYVEGGFPTRLGLLDALYRAGHTWHDSRKPSDKTGFQNSDVPSIVLANQYDPVTPPENGHNFMESITNGWIYIVDEGGHGTGNQACKNKIIMAFMDNPTVKPDDTCLNLIHQ